MRGDFSRLTFRPERPYSSVRMQQGRVPLDADWNEQVDIEAYIRRRAVLDLVGHCCIPEAESGSFEVTVSGGQIQVAPGRAWVQGVLCEASEAQTLDVPAGAGRYAAYLEIFERHVTALEDPEIREIALGGPDTATRTETVCRARVAPIDAGQTCSDLEDWVPPGQTSGEMTASTAAQPPDTPCVVPEAAGYARLENQLYRVEIHRSGEIGGATPPTFKWSRDNGSITAEWLGTDGNEIIIPNPGRDDVLGFHDNRWIELGHDALDLAGEAGPIVEVIGRRTDSTGRYRLEFDAHGQTIPDPATVGHPKVRRWDHDAGSDPGLGDVAIGAADTAITLEGGIEVSFSAGFYRSGDYWLIPARTFIGEMIGDILWPRDAADNPLAKPPDGVTRYFCRLAVFDVTANGASQPTDCRHTFTPLCELQRGSSCCCTITVGSPNGDVATITEALARLPEEGGEICVLPGTYRERVIIDDRRDIVIHGCGPRARIEAPDPNPAIFINDSERITIRSLSVVAPESRGIEVSGGNQIRLEDLDMLASRQPAVVASGADFVSLLDSRIQLEPLAGAGVFLDDRWPAVFVAGNDQRIEGNRILAAEVRQSDLLPGGGIQIGGASERVDIRRNLIQGGVGPGIALGSITVVQTPPDFGGFFDSFTAAPVSDPREVAGSSRLQPGVNHFANLERQPDPTHIGVDTALGVFVRRRLGIDNAVSDGDLYDVTIEGNRIREMGASGITVVHFFDLRAGRGDFISVHRLAVTGNLIERCVSLRHEPVPEALAEDSAIGGIALADADDLVLRDNDIERNGIAVRNPVCGVFLLHSRGVEIHRNRIRHNGQLPDPQTPASLDRRGGIVLGFAEVPVRAVQLRPNDEPRRRQDGTPAVRIHDNIVVAMEGRALEAVALGPVSIQGNQFTALGADFRNRSTASPVGLQVPPNSPFAIFTAALGGAVVLVLNLGVSNEFYFQLAGVAGLGLTGSLAQPAGDTFDKRPVLAGGNIQFQDNQVVLDALDGLNTFALSAMTFFTLDDLAVEDNQSDCDLAIDLALTNLLALGFSLRATGNRFKEGILNALLSAMTLGFLNTTTDNQGTHCFVRVAPVIPPVHENTVIIQRLPGGERQCERMAVIERNLRAAIFGG